MSRSPRIGLVVNEYSQQIGGMSTVARATARYLHDRGYDLHLFTNRQCEPDPVIPTHPILTTDLARDLPRLARFKMDLWHSLNYGYAPLSLLCRPFVLTVHGNDFLSPWVRFKFERAPLLWRLARRDRGRGWTQRLVDAVSLASVDEVIAVSRFTAELFRKTCRCGRSPTVVPNGVEEFFLQESVTPLSPCSSSVSPICRPASCPESPSQRPSCAEPPRQQPSCPEGAQVCSQGRKPLVQARPRSFSPEEAAEIRHPRRLISVAALYGWQRKNIDGVIRAVALIGDRLDLEYCIVGEGTGRPALEQLARQLGVSHRIRFLGRLDQEALRQAYASASLFVLAPRPTAGDVEGFGLVYLEAAGSGTPCLGTRFGGTADAIAEGESGFFADDATPEALARALEKFFTGQIRFDTETVRAHARRHAWPVVLRQVEAIYARVCPQVAAWVESAESTRAATSPMSPEFAECSQPMLTACV